MGNSTSKSPSVSKQDEAVLQLKLQRDSLKRYKKRITVIIEREHQVAKQCLQNGDKKRALLALKKKKYQENQVEELEKQMTTLEELTQSVEFAQLQQSFFKSLQQGNNILKELNKELSIEKVEKLLDDSSESIAYQNELNEMLSKNINPEDEMDVLEELEQMEKEELNKNQLPDIHNKTKSSEDLQNAMPKVPKTKLPDVPTKKQEQQPEEEEDTKEKQMMAA